MPEIDHAHLRRLCGWDMTTRRPGGSRRTVHAGLTWPGLVVALMDEADVARRELAVAMEQVGELNAACVEYEKIRRDAALGAKVREGVMRGSFPLGMLLETCEYEAKILMRRRYSLASGAMYAIADALREEAGHG